MSADNTMPDAAAKPKFFHGWVVVAAAFAVTCMGFGSAYSFSAFVDSLQRDFGASRGSVSLVFSLAGCLYFGFGVFSGPLADRYGAKLLAITGMLMVGVGLVAASFARSLFEVYLAYGLGVGLGVGCAYVPVVGAVQRWFVRRRGLASGLATSGIGLGTLVMPAVVMDCFGGRNVSGIIGIPYTSVALGTLVGPSVAGFAFDISHSYTAPIVASICANLIAVAVMAISSRVTPGSAKHA